MIKAVFITATIFLLSITSLAVNKNSRALGFYVENDSRDLGGPGSDNAYSSGFRFSYIIASEDTPTWATSLVEAPQGLDPAFKTDYSNFGVSLGQQIYTPNDIRDSALIASDRPYAAWLYVGFMAHFKNENRSHVFELDLGVVGPEAQGEKFQNEYHRIIGKYFADGWHHQIATEPTVQLVYQQRQKFVEMKTGNRNRYFDAIPYYGAGLGNVAVDAHVGGVLRFGSYIPDDFGPKRASNSEGDTFIEPSASPAFFVYGFAGGRGSGILKNIFLDGNTFRQSHRVTRIPFVIETEIGVASGWKGWNLAWRFVSRSPEFTERTVYNSFASISISKTL